ncbi:MAG TPA: DUF4249 domain-containing protein [Puia sp.]|nr:DUF4249 domain-containing protein [Puia sp.]
MNPKLRVLIGCLALCLVWPWGGCKQSYSPPAIEANPNILVVDGVLNGGPGQVTTMRLSRSQKIGDSLGGLIPEPNDKLVIQGEAGDNYALTDQGKGFYTSAGITLNPAKKYRLQITTSSGIQYLSDYVTVAKSPPIDSLSWQQQRDVTVSVSTHDPANQSHYYQWDYVETWEYHSPLQSILAVQNHKIYYTDFLDSTKQTRTCWETANSTNISLASSVGLSQDLVNQSPITTVLNGSSKLDVRYSILVNQYVLTQPAYQYWSILQKNTQQMGSLFDAQPSQLVGNIHRVNNAAEPVIGYLTASSVEQKRLFIHHNELSQWDSIPIACETRVVGQNPNDFSDYPYDNPASPYYTPGFLPYYFSSGAIVLARSECVDCLVRGGTNQRPSFW